MKRGEIYRRVGGGRCGGSVAFGSLLLLFGAGVVERRQNNLKQVVPKRARRIGYGHAHPTMLAKVSIFAVSF